MTVIGRLIQFWIFLFLVSCSPTTLEDLRFEGESETKKLTAELRKVESVDDLEKALPKIKKRFSKLADVLCEVRNFPNGQMQPTEASDALFLELARIYEMQGGKELVERSQCGAVQRLNRRR